MNPLLRTYYLAVGRFLRTRWWNAYYRRLYRLMPARAFRGVGGVPVVLLTTIGRRSGVRRASPVVGWPDGEMVIVVASNAGREKHPDWYLNLSANPEVELNEGGRVRQMHARDATVEERDRLWPTLLRGYGGYEAYRAATSRRIPIVVLEPR
jgi:deazaflavin-dependent oxidoreductase (nitroreductase family)